ncbi:Unconventional myosin-XVI [Branchiostoma belcheri]|nr:Unconventional myosin-XVI [Branchiostoma belcheri]
MDGDEFRRAVGEGDVQTVRRGLQAGRDVNQRFPWLADRTALHVASWHGQTIDDRTALHWASVNGHTGVVKLLIQHGADVGARDKYDRTALHRTSDYGQTGVVELLIQHGADVGARDENGRTALHWASVNGHTGVVKLVIQHGADVEARDNDGGTALHQAIRKRHTRIVELLIRHGAHVTARDKGGMTALHWASGNGQTGIVEMLIQHGADVGARDKYGRTALFWASRRGQTGVVELLIQHGADVGARDEYGKTPLDFVRDQNRRRFLKKLATEASYHKLMKQSGGEKVDRFKLCFCGPQEAGKSTLVESLETGFVFAFIRDRMTPDDQPHEPTPGVNVGTTNIPGVGQVSVWDFAGQSEYAVTHSMFMDAENTIFIVLYNIMVDLKKQKRELSRLLLHCPVAVSHSHVEGSRQADVVGIANIQCATVHWWLCFIKSCNTKSKPHVILAASHADQTDTGHQRASFILELMTSEFKNFMNISNDVFLLDCRKTRQTDMWRLKDLLTGLKTQLLAHQRAIPKLCAEIIKRLPKWAEQKCRPKCPVLQWAEYKEAAKEIDRLIDEDFLKTSSQYLDHLGEILFVPLQNADPIIVLKPNWLCTDVFGKVMAPENFPIQHLRTSEGEDVDVVTKEEIQRVFQDVADVDLLITLLQEFQLCHTYDRKEFIIPGLLTQTMPPEKWQPTANPAKTVYFGKQVQCADTTDMFSSAFFPRVQTRLMRELKNRPLLWRDGAKCFDSNVESLIKLSPDGRAVNICVRSEQGDKLSCRQMLEKIENILINVLDEVSPGTTTEERVLSARALKEHREEIHSYSKDQINKAKAEDGSVHLGILGFSEDVDDLLCGGRDDEEEQGAVGYSHQEPRVYEMHNHIINAGDGAVINMYQGATGQLEQLQWEGDVGQLQLEGDVGQLQLEGDVGQPQLEGDVGQPQ